MKKDPELEKLLQNDTPPEIDSDIRKKQIIQLSGDIRNMDYLPPQSFIGQILTQLSFISGWVWFVQAGILFLLFFCVFRAHPLQIDMMMLCLSPGLSLILVWEMTKSFRMNIWEMESACRYNLAQIFFFRLCILFGGDFLVLTGALIAYRMADGLLWQFCLYALLPFFLTSALSLYALRLIGNRCNVAMAATIPLLAGNAVAWAVVSVKEYLASRNISFPAGIPLITLLAFAALLYNALQLCTGVHHLHENRKEYNTWNFESRI
ncbi:MAG: hypothetical protein NC331_04150 [Lachnospiraceae bacterium]|nr:hypothetical protein [Lachnospiraceae bacterium]MCM1238556.1 hypothetical protein [Lachnospiraceae bacterium]